MIKPTIAPLSVDITHYATQLLTQGPYEIWKKFLNDSGVEFTCRNLGDKWYWTYNAKVAWHASGPYSGRETAVNSCLEAMVCLTFEGVALSITPHTSDTAETLNRAILGLIKPPEKAPEPTFTIGEVDRQIQRLRSRQGSSRGDDRKAAEILENLKGRAKVLAPEGWVKLPDEWMEGCKYTDEQVRDRIEYLIGGGRETSRVVRAGNMLEYFFRRDITRTMPPPEGGGVDDTASWVEYDGARYHLLSDVQIAQLERAKLMGERVMKMLDLPSPDPTREDLIDLLNKLDTNSLLVEDRNALISLLIAELQGRTLNKDPNEVDLKGLTVEQATLVRGVINAFRGDK